MSSPDKSIVVSVREDDLKKPKIGVAIAVMSIIVLFLIGLAFWHWSIAPKTTTNVTQVTSQPPRYHSPLESAEWRMVTAPVNGLSESVVALPGKNLIWDWATPDHVPFEIIPDGDESRKKVQTEGHVAWLDSPACRVRFRSACFKSVELKCKNIEVN